MDPEEFRRFGRDVVDYIANYMETTKDRNPLPSISPGYLKDLIPDEAPQDSEKWEDVLKDVNRVIVPGVLNCIGSHYHAYFPTGFSIPSLLGGLLCEGFGNIVSTWMLSPAGTELEMSMMNWMAKMLQLPSEFLFREGGHGGGVIQGSASESTLIALLSARTAVFRELMEKDSNITQGQIIDKIVAYTSEDAHVSVEKAGLISNVKIRKLSTDENGSLRGSTLEKAIQEDKANGLVPFFLCATIGTTSCCALDNLVELGPLCQANNMWLHVDAAYAGSACICPEFRYVLDGVEYCTSLNFNAHKWLRVIFECSLMWVKDSRLITSAFELNPLYMRFDDESSAMPEYRHWQIPSCRRFRSLKVWFVLRMFGVKGLQEHIRKDVALAKLFEKHVRGDDRFEIFGKVTLGLVCFRLKKGNDVNEALFKRIHKDKRILMVPAFIKGCYYLRFVISSSTIESPDVDYAWTVIQEVTTQLLKEHTNA